MTTLALTSRTTRPTYCTIDLAALYDEALMADPQRHRLLSRDEELACATARKAGDERGRVVLVLLNQRLVFDQRTRYTRLTSAALSLEDLLQEGMLGLLRAAQGFEAERGLRFSTYAVWWIRQAMTRAVLEKTRFIRYPVHIEEQLTHLRNERSRTGSSDYDTLCDTLGWSQAQRNRLRPLVDAPIAPISLNKSVVADDDLTLMDLIPDERLHTDQTALALIEREEQRTQLATLYAAAGLSAREREVLAMRYGLSDGAPLTLEAIGTRVGLTRERVRQIINQALEKLRAVRGVRPNEAV